MWNKQRSPCCWFLLLFFFVWNHFLPLLVEEFCWLLACFTSQQHASVSQGWIRSDNCTCFHIETEVADQTFYLTHSKYTDTRPTSHSTDPITPSVGKIATGVSIWYDLTCKHPYGQSGIGSQICCARDRRLNHSANEAD